MKSLYLIHTGRSYLPELEAYKRFFGQAYTLNVVEKGTFPPGDYKSSVLWFFMGLYPNKYRADFIIHDYRSLSTGYFPRIKNQIKKTLNQRPDLRVFLNERGAREYNFNDKVPFVFIDMGIHEHLRPQVQGAKDKFLYDFCYVGDVFYKRQIDRLLESFSKTYSYRTLVLVGRYDPSIKEAFKANENILFLGKRTLRDTYKIISDSEFALCYLPNKYPYFFQTPTKLLEYAALGKKIIVNDVASNILTCTKYNINVEVVKGHDIPDGKSLKTLKDNSCFDSSCIAWEGIIKRSGVLDYLM